MTQHDTCLGECVAQGLALARPLAVILMKSTNGNGSFVAPF